MKAIFGHYISGWKWTINNWRLLTLLFFCNYILSIITLKPLNSFLQNKLEWVFLPNSFPEEFNFSLFSDIFRTNPQFLDSMISLLVWSFPIYLIWIIFSSAGIVSKAINNEAKDTKLLHFWSGGSTFFFKFLRLSTYYVLGICLLFSISGALFSLNQLNIFSMEDENVVIYSFYTMIILLILATFILKSALDLIKILIVQDNTQYINGSIKRGFKLLTTTKVLQLSILNVLVLAILLLILYIVKTNIPSTVGTTIATSLVLLLRISLRMVRIASFETLARNAN